MSDQHTQDILKAIENLDALAAIADRFIKRKINPIYWKRQKKNAQANSAFLNAQFVRKPFSRYKNINVAFILVNKDTMNLRQMADALNVSHGKIKSTIKEFKIDYKPKRSTIY